MFLNYLIFPTNSPKPKDEERRKPRKALFVLENSIIAPQRCGPSAVQINEARGIVQLPEIDDYKYVRVQNWVKLWPPNYGSQLWEGTSIKVTQN